MLTFAIPVLKMIIYNGRAGAKKFCAAPAQNGNCALVSVAHPAGLNELREQRGRYQSEKLCEWEREWDEDRISRSTS